MGWAIGATKKRGEGAIIGEVLHVWEVMVLSGDHTRHEEEKIRIRLEVAYDLGQRLLCGQSRHKAFYGSEHDIHPNSDQSRSTKDLHTRSSLYEIYSRHLIQALQQRTGFAGMSQIQKGQCH